MTGSAEQSARDVATSEPVKIAARGGLVAYGITHLLIAGIALNVAFGGSGEKADQSGAFQALAQQPFGRIALWVLVVGFAAVALWRFELSIWGYEYETESSKKIRRRVSSGAKAVVFVAFGVLAATTAAGGGSGGGGQGVTATVLELPGGQLIVGAAGITILVIGVVKIVQGWQESFRGDMSLPVDPRARRVAVRLGLVGFIAKGASIGLIGVLVVVAAIRFRPEEASGLDAALKGLAAQPFGPYLLAAVALGLGVYGVFCFIDARYHRV